MNRLSGERDRGIMSLYSATSGIRAYEYSTTLSIPVVVLRCY